MASITYQNASCIYEGSDKLAVDDLNLDIQDGGLVVLVGSSGSGKSTALRSPAWTSTRAPSRWAGRT